MYNIIFVKVLSNSVSEAIKLQGGPNSFETFYFIDKIDKFFLTVSMFLHILLGREGGSKLKC